MKLIHWIAHRLGLQFCQREARRERELEDNFEQDFDARSRELDLEFARAVERCAKCTHERTVRTVQVVYGYETEKCVTCWAFRMPDGSWAPNSTPPP
jgi:hypothetical protein